MNIFYKTLICLWLMVTVSSLYAEGEAFEPMTKERLDEFYSTPERNVTVIVCEGEKRHVIPEGFLGVNLSYFNTTDEIWDTYDFLGKLKKSGVGSLRYPGGEETTFFHWEHPGVNGYEDLWDPKSQHGVSPGRGKFQVTWVAPKDWDSNENFMDFDEYIDICRQLGAEPIVGINLESGKKHNRQKDGIDEALRWMRYCEKKKFKVTYWFLDNEPWHGESNYSLNNQVYAEEVLAYGTAIKKEFPEVKLIANPTSSSSYNYWEGLETFIRKTGHVIDYLDVHWYWAWGLSSFDYWRDQMPLQATDKWKSQDQHRPYCEDIRLIKEACKRAGAEHLGLVVLEWNIGPSDWSQTFNQSLIAIIQSELLMEYAKADVHLTCLWTLLWQTSRDVWSEQDFFPSIVTHDLPYEKTLSLDMFRLVSPIQGKRLVESESDQDNLRTLVVEGPSGRKHLLIINKNALRRKINIQFETHVTGVISAEMIALKNQVCLQTEVYHKDQKQIYFYAEPYSFTAIAIK